MKNTFFGCIISTSALLTYAQTPSVPLFKIDFAGYIKHETFVDSREIVSEKSQQRLLFPQPRFNDILGKDINSKAHLNMNTIETRIWTDIRGPNVGKAKANGFIEVDFLGTKDIVSILYMRHAYINFRWQNNEFLAGHTWHPFTIADCKTGVISGNDGRPIEPNARNPQLRYTRLFDNTRLILTAISQINDTSDGPFEYSARYIRNAIIPDLSAKLEYRNKDHIFGIVGDIKRLVPRLESDKGYKVHEENWSSGLVAYTRLLWKPFQARLKMAYIENGSELSLIGGYAVHSINPITDERTYANIRTLSFWASFELLWSVSPGLFIGYTKNLGATKTIIPRDAQGTSLIYRRNENLDEVFRISSRLRWHVEPFVLGAELEWTKAAFGTIRPKGTNAACDNVSVVRALLAFYYYF